LITGEQDFLAPPALVSDMAGAIPGGEFVEVKGAGHPIHHEQPDLLVKLVVDLAGQALAPERPMPVQHRHEVLTRILGFEEAEVRALEREGVIGSETLATGD
jgi:hypothetical protein